MTLKDKVQEIVNTWMIIAEEDRPLTKDEEEYMLKMQQRIIEELKEEDGILDQEELQEEYSTKTGFGIQGDRK